MDSSRIREWLEIIGIFSVVASLLFVGLEVRQSRQIAYMEQLGVARQIVTDFRQTLIANSDVWLRGCNGEELSDSDRFIFAQLVLELRGTVATLNARGNIGIYASSSRWLNNWAATLHRYPAVLDAVTAINEASFDYSESIDDSLAAGGAFYGLEEAVAARLAELERLEPDPSMSRVYCGSL